MRAQFTRGLGGVVGLGLLLLVGLGLTPSIVGNAVDVICTGCVASTDISDGGVALADMANLATDKLIGRVSSGTGVPEAVAFTDAGQAMVAAASATAQTALLDAATTTTAGTIKIAPAVIPITAATQATTWTDMPAAVTAFNGSNVYVQQVDLTNRTQFRVVAKRSGGTSAAGFDLCGAFATDCATFSAYLDGTTTGSNCDASSGFITPDSTATAPFTGAWTNLAAGAKADVCVTVYGSGGNGTADPVFGSVSLWVR